jgi:Uma2 family endonuclease
VAFYSFVRVPRGRLPSRCLDVVPELIVEVRSPSDRWSELYTKAGEYTNAGVSIVVVLDDQDQTASIFTADGVKVAPCDADLSLTEVLPGFSVPVRRFIE